MLNAAKVGQMRPDDNLWVQMILKNPTYMALGDLELSKKLKEGGFTSNVIRDVLSLKHLCGS